MFTCEKCGKEFKTENGLHKHMGTCRKNDEASEVPVVTEEPEKEKVEFVTPEKIIEKKEDEGKTPLMSMNVPFTMTQMTQQETKEASFVEPKTAKEPQAKEISKVVCPYCKKKMDPKDLVKHLQYCCETLQ